MSEENPAPIPVLDSHKSKPDWAKRVGCGIVIAYILFSIVILSLPVVLRPRHGCRPDITEAIHNARQTGLMLMDFEGKYGAFPSDATVALVTKSHPDHGYDLSSKSSNALFLQLLAANLTQIESMFYAKVKNTRKADGVIIPGEALKRSEVGFAYISGLSSANDPKLPIVFTPIIPRTTQFDPEPFDGKAVVLFTDNSVRAYKIEKDGHIYDDKGIDLLSPKNPIWKGKKPDIRYPDL